MKSDKVSNAAVIAVTLAVLVAIALFFRQVYVYYRDIQTGGSASPPQFSTTASLINAASSGDADEVFDVESASAPATGPKDAKLKVVEFIDFECPYTKDAYGIVRALSLKYADDVSFEMRDFPVTEIHQFAMGAAEAAGCAQAQGKYWEMHDRLFGTYGQLDRDNLDAIAMQSGLDAAKFKSCMDGHLSRSAINKDIADAKAAGVRGTPTFFFNGHKAEGVISKEDFEKIIDGLLARP